MSKALTVNIDDMDAGFKAAFKRDNAHAQVEIKVLVQEGFSTRKNT